jgi:hypothetical protein
MGDHESAAADVARFGVHDGQCELDSDGRIDRVTALLQDVQTHFASEGMSRGYTRMPRNRYFLDVVVFKIRLTRWQGLSKRNIAE